MYVSKPFLMVQFRTDSGKQLEQISVKEKMTCEGQESPGIHFLDAFDSKNGNLFATPDLFLPRFQGVILGGSAEYYFGGNTSSLYDARHQAMLARLHPFMNFLLKNDFPTLGICFGHQFLAYSLGANVVADADQSERGALMFQLSSQAAKDPLFANMPNFWRAFFLHRDSVESLPEGTVLLGNGEHSKIGAFRYKKNIYGVQFHPELDKHDLPSRLRLHPEYFTQEGGGSFHEEMSCARQILKNFVQLSVIIETHRLASKQTWQ